MLLARIITELNFKYANGIIFISNYALSRNKKYDYKSTVIHHGVDRVFFNRKINNESFFSKKRPLRIIYPSSFFGYKNHFLVLNSLENLKNDIFIELIFVGDLKTAKQRLLKKIMNFKKSNIKIKLIDQLNHIDLNKLYDYVDLGLFASKCENLPNILLEMMSKGLPIISSDYGSHIEILGSNGLYFNKNNYRDLSNKLEIIYKSENIRNKISENNYVISQNYNWHETTEQTINFIKTTVKSV